MSYEHGGNGADGMNKRKLAKALILLVGGLVLVIVCGYDICWQALHPFPAAQSLIDESQDFEVIIDMFLITMGLIGAGAGTGAIIRKEKTPKALLLRQAQ